MQQTQAGAVMDRLHPSSCICLLWLGFIFLHFLSTSNIESAFFIQEQ